MNDRFRFRAWNKTAKRYVDDVGELLFRKDGCVYSIGFKPTNNHEYIIEQCMGRKDVNGKLIYEGDIVRANLPQFYSKDVFHLTTGLVCWNGFGFSLQEKYSTCIMGHAQPYIEVIGNIHENPELMEEQKCQ